MPNPPKRKARAPADPLAAYKRIRKPMPPPERILPDKRRKTREREAQREEREGPDEGPGE